MASKQPAVASLVSSGAQSASLATAAARVGPPRAYVNELDLLRFIAAVGVVLYHYGFRGFAADNLTVMPYPGLAPFAKYGYLGVELFFMISGFLMLMTAKSGDVQRFVVGRIARLYPAFWTCCSLTFIVVVLAKDPRFSASWSQYAVNLTMLSQFVGVSAIDGAYWSLFVEIKFYALVAVLLWSGNVARVEPCLWAWLCITAPLLGHEVGKWRSLLIVDYASYLIAGATLYQIWDGGPSWSRIALLLSSWIESMRQGTLELVGIEQHYHTVMNPLVICAVLSAFFVFLTLVATGRTGVFREIRWTVIGGLTYPLYLTHQKVGYIIFNRLYPGLSSHVILWGTFAAMLLVSYAVYAAIERRSIPWIRGALNSLTASSAARFRPIS